MPRRKHRVSTNANARPPASKKPTEVVPGVNGRSHPATARRATRAEVEELCGAGLAVEQAGDKPSWDHQPRALRWRGAIIRSWRRAAPNQEAALDAFEKEGWPDAINDPLEPDDHQESKARLREMVRGLNKGLKAGTIRFRSSNGRGDGVLWECVEENAQHP
jgi:hypothetical protein